MAFGSSIPRGLRIALDLSKKYIFRLPEVEIDHLVIGGGMSRTWLSRSSLCSYHHLISGVVGLSVARQLVLHHSEKTTYLVERHNRAGEETRWTPGTQSMGSSLIRLSLAPVTRKWAMEVCPSQDAKTNKVLIGLNQAFTISPTHSRLVCIWRTTPPSQAL